MDSDRLAEIRQRADAATPGPWSRHDFGFAGQDEPSSIVVFQGIEFDWRAVMYDNEFVCQMPTWDRQEDDDALFIAHARQDVPDLLAEVDRLAAENADLRRTIAQYTDGRPALHCDPTGLTP